MANGAVSGLSKKTCPAKVGTGADFGEISMHFHANVSTRRREKIRFHGGNFWMEIMEMFGAEMPAKPCRATICGQGGPVEIKGTKRVCKSLKFLILPLSTLFSPPTEERRIGTSPPFSIRAGRRAAGKNGEKIKTQK